MGLFDLFRSRRSRDDSESNAPADAGPERHQKLRDAWEAIETERFEDAASLAQQYTTSADSKLKLESKKLIALVHFRQQDYAAAAPLFKEVAAASDDAFEWFNVVTSATLAGDIPLGEEAFQQALKCQEAAGYSQQPSVPFMRLYFACALRDRGEHRRALAQIEELRSIYEQLKITDDHFLHMRGVPFLSQTMDVVVDVLRGLGDSFDANGWLDAFAEVVDDQGRAYLAMAKERLTNDE